MTITLKSIADLKLIAQSGVTTRQIDDKLSNLFNFIGGQTLNVDDIVVRLDGTGGKIFTFMINTLSPERNFYSVKIPENWCATYDLESMATSLFCKACSFTVRPNAYYHFADGKVLVSGTPGTADAVYRKELYSDRIADPEKDVVCPVCMKKNRFGTLA